MAEYEMLFFLTAGELRAAEVCADGDVKLINFHGDNAFSFKGTEEIDEAYSIIADTYSVDELSELDASFVVADCGADEQIKWYLLEKLHPCGKLNTIMLDKVLPCVLTKAGCCQAGKKTIVELFEEKYAYICDDDCHFEEIAAKGKNADIVLDVKDFAFLAVWDGKTFAGGNKDAVEAVVAEKEAAVAELEQKIAQLQEENADLVKKLEAANQEIAEFKNKLEQKEGEAAKKASEKIVSHRRCVTLVRGSDDNYIKIGKSSGEIVKANEKVAVTMYARTSTYIPQDILSPRAGKIVWLLLDGDELKINYGKEKVVAVVGDEDDNEEEMFAWGQKQLEKKIADTQAKGEPTEFEKETVGLELVGKLFGCL